MIGGGEIFATASLNDDTPDGYLRRRHLYHTNRELYYRMQHEQNHSIEQERLLYDRNLRNEEELRSVEHVRLFQATSTITVNPTLWAKVKIFGTGVKLALKATWRSEPIGVIYMTLLGCLITFIGIMKLFGA